MIYIFIFIFICAVGYSQSYIAPNNPHLTVINKKKSFIVLTVLSILLFIGGFRHEVGCDYYGYYNRFVNFVNQDYNNFLQNFSITSEPGFQFLSQLLSANQIEYQWLNVATLSILLFGIFRISRHTPNPTVFVAIIFPICILQLGFSGLRQASAVGLILASTAFSIERQRGLSWLLLLLAISFHNSAALALPTMFLTSKRLSARQLASYLLVSLIAAYLFGGERIAIYQSRYIEQIYGENSSVGAIFRYMAAIIPILCFLYMKKNLKINNKKFENILLYYSAIAIMSFVFLFISTVALHRLTFYILPFSSIMFLIFCHKLSVKHNNFNINIIPAIFSFVYLIGWMNVGTHFSRCYTPYQNHLFDNVSYRM